MMAIVHTIFDGMQLELGRILVDIGSHMLPLVRFFGLVPCSFQSLQGHYFRIQTPGVGAYTDVVAVIGLLIQECLDGCIGHVRIDEWAVRCNPDHHLCMRFLRSSIVAIEHIFLRTSKSSDPASLAVVDDCVVPGLDGRGYYDVRDQPRT